MNAVDAILALLLAFALMRGWSRGLVGAVASYAGPVLGVMIAADFSDPVRDSLAASVPAPDFVIEALAPLVVFVVVVAAVRVAAAFLARLLGVGMSAPSRVLAAALSASVVAVILGACVLVVREMKPVEVPDDSDEPGEILASPFGRFMADLDARLSSSLLAPALADAASVVVSEAVLASNAPPPGFGDDEEPGTGTRSADKAPEAAAPPSAGHAKAPATAASGARR